MSAPESDHYATLGLDRHCTLAQIRAAYRLFAKRHHPDLNPGSADAVTHSQAINAAHEVLIDPARRRAYDRELDRKATRESAAPKTKIERNIAQDAHLRIEDFLRGATLDVRVRDPINPGEAEAYRVEIPSETAPGTRIKIPRAAPFEGGFVNLRLRALPGFRFKVRGSDLRCDLKIKAQRAAQGGVETIAGATGAPLRVTIPRSVGRGELIRIVGEGLPRPRGGRGDLLVSITYRPQVSVTRNPGR